MTRPCLIVCGLLLTSCTVEHYLADADREVAPILERFEREGLGGRRQWVQQPDPARLEEAPVLPDSVETPDAEVSSRNTHVAAPPAEEPDTLRINLETALELAIQGNRSFQSQRESLYLSALGFASTRYSFTPQVSAAMSFVFGDSSSGPRNHSLGSSLGVSQILPTGGSVSIGTGLSTSRTGGPHFGDPDKGRSFGTSASISLSQPLLRGFGKEVALEGLVQSERSMVYTIRNFELFRQDFSIQIAEQYFNLVSQKRSLVIEEQRYQDAIYDRRKAEAMNQVDRGAIEDVFLARRGEKSAESGVIQAQVDYQRAVDRFKVDLGLPVTTNIVIVEQDPPFEPVDFDPDSAVKVAISNSLEVMNRRDQLEDSARGLRITRQNLLPDLDLNLNYSVSDSGGRQFASAVVDRNSPESRGGSLSFNVPLSRRSERDSYRAALFGFEQSKRGFEEFLDDISNNIEDSIRSLQQTAEQIEIQEESVVQDQRSIIRTEINIDRGQADNRALLEARNAVANGRIQLNTLRARHFIQTLRLRRELGLLFIDEKGMWQ